MGVFDLAKADSKRFTQHVPLTFYRMVEEDDEQVEQGVDVLGMFTNHHLGIDPDTRTLVNSHNIQCTIHESILVDAGYSTRNSNGYCNLKDTFVKGTNHLGVEKDYIIVEVYPDDTLGIIVCTLAELD